jgi:M6 family metalloprotease-like protein
MRPRALLAAVAVVAGCSDSIVPTRIDPPPTPYRVSPRGVRVNGVTKMLVIPVVFEGGAAPAITPARLRSELFGDLDDGGVTRAFGLAAGGKFALRADVVPWLPVPMVLGVGLNVDTLASWAIKLADSHVNYGSYDSDGPDGIANSGDDDGIVDGGVAIVIPELNRGCPGPGIHPFARLSWGLGTTNPRPPFPTSDLAPNGGTIGINGFTMMSATECVGGRAPVATMAHELGHLLFGITDLYHQADPNVPANELWRGRRWIVGCWELMAAGSGWGCGSGAPAGTTSNATFAAWTRAEIGWVTPTEIPVDVDATYDLVALDRGGTVLSIPLSAQERVLVEYRQRMTGDAVIPADGVLLYHVVDTLPYRPVPTAPRRYRVMLIEADADGALVRIHSEGGDRGVAGDAFGSAVRTFSAVTHPGVTRANGAAFPFAIENITFNVAAKTARFRLRPVAVP